MLSEKQVHQGRVIRRFTAPIIEDPSLDFSIKNPSLVQHRFLNVEVVYRSTTPFDYPHRYRLVGSLPEDNPFRFTDRVMLSPSGQEQAPSHQYPFFYCTDGWVIGVHYQLNQMVELTLIAMCEGLLQLVFLQMPIASISPEGCPKFKVLGADGKTEYWFYMTTADIRQRAQLTLRAPNEDLKYWGHTYAFIERLLITLRSTPIGRHLFLDPMPNLVRLSRIYC